VFGELGCVIARVPDVTCGVWIIGLCYREDLRCDLWCLVNCAVLYGGSEM
jgi:hypothetical protein